MTARALEVDTYQLSSATVTRYRLDAIAADVTDVVAAAGGWLFDRAMSGWDVNLHLADPSNTRALRILGIKAYPLELASERPLTHTLAVSAEMLNAEACVRDLVISMLERGVTEVALWGDTWPPELHHRAQRIGHRLSGAARAFKGHALAAAELPTGLVSDTEAFHGGVPWGLPYESDLRSIG